MCIGDTFSYSNTRLEPNYSYGYSQIAVSVLFELFLAKSIFEPNLAVSDIAFKSILKLFVRQVFFFFFFFFFLLSFTYCFS